MPSTSFALTGVGLDLDLVSVDGLVGQEPQSGLSKLPVNSSKAIADSR